VLEVGLEDFYCDYEPDAHLESAELYVPVLSALHERISDVFNEHGVALLSPHYVMDPAEPAVVPKERWWAARARPS